VTEPRPERGARRPDFYGRFLSAVPLLVAYFGLTALFAWQASRHPVPTIFTDELEMTQLSRSIAETGEAARRGVPYGVPSLVAYILAPVWWLSPTTTAYATAKVVLVLAMTAALFPAYALARLVVPRWYAIGAATADVFAQAGAEVALLDRDGKAAQEKARAIGGAAIAIPCDVTDAKSVHSAFDRVVTAFGGVDIAVSNAGAAWQGRIGEVDDAILRKSFELNFFAHQTVAQAAVGIMLAQGTGGCLLFNVSKQAVNPGANFGPYGLPKAATLDDLVPNLSFLGDDLPALQQRMKDIGSQPVGPLARPDLPLLRPDMSPVEALLLFYRHRSTLPVVDEASGKLVGVMSYWDALAAISGRKA